jgi:hypothetical protein
MKSKSQLSPDRALGVLGACLGIGAALALLTFLFLGLTVWTAAVAALLLVCPVIIGWGAWITARRRPPRLPGGRPPLASAE